MGAFAQTQEAVVRLPDQVAGFNMNLGGVATYRPGASILEFGAAQHILTTRKPILIIFGFI